MSQGYIDMISAKGLKKPWRFDNMSEQQFLAKADTGDLLLFRSTNGVSKITRGFTKSHFDHVAMILKFETDPNEVYMIEATGNMGVALNRWLFLRDHIGSDKFYDKVVFRHINFDRGNTMVDKLEKFLSQAVGHGYGLTGKKMFRANSIRITN